MVKVLKPFHDAPSGRYVRPGDEVEPTPGRHDELAANGLVSPREAGAKSDPAPANKMADAPANKAGPAVTPPPILAPVPAPERRGPGRPPKVR